MKIAKIKNHFLRKEGPPKLKGESKFVDDLKFPKILHGATVRSNVPRGILKKINFEGDIPWDEFTIVTAKDIPGNNHIAMLENDWPFLADESINHNGEPVALIAHHNKILLEKALKNIRLEIEVLPAVFTIEESLEQKEIIWGSDNILKSYSINKGEVDKAWREADVVIEGEYETGAQEQLYIENNGMVAIANKESGVTVWGSMQCPYYVHGALTKLFNYPAEKIRIIQTETGGAFGGKEDYPSIIAGHAALLAYKSGRPVKLIYDRVEDLSCTTKRHPSRTRHKTAVRKDGKILGMEIDFVLDGGAYATLSAVVLSRGAIHAAGPYLCDNARITARAVATNKPSNGAFRGFGAPQSFFAMERHMDVIAKELGMTPIDIRKKNFLKRGDSTAIGQVIKERLDFDRLLDQALEKSNYHQKTEAFEQHNKSSHIKKGMGISCVMHGSGFTGSGEKNLASIAGLAATREGKIRVLTSSTEMGQGKNTIFTQIVCKALNILPEDVAVPRPDTSEAPNSGPTVASRTTMIVGKLIEGAAIGLKKTLISAGYLQEGFSRDDFIKAVRNYLEAFGELKSFNQYEHPDFIEWDEEKHWGDAYATYAWAVNVAEVSVNTITYETNVEKFISVQEIGNVVNPTLAEGQIEGGIVQGIGFALYEKVVWENGIMANNRMTNYIIPTSMDIPDIGVYFEEWNKDFGPGGAKGIGELPMDGPAPAVINAVGNAVNRNINMVPMMPEDLMNVMETCHE